MVESSALFVKGMSAFLQLAIRSLINLWGFFSYNSKFNIISKKNLIIFDLGGK